MARLLTLLPSNPRALIRSSQSSLFPSLFCITTATSSHSPSSDVPPTRSDEEPYLFAATSKDCSRSSSANAESESLEEVGEKTLRLVSRRSGEEASRTGSRDFLRGRGVGDDVSVPARQAEVKRGRVRALYQQC